MTLLSSVLSPSPRSRETVILIQSTFATPWLPLLHAILNASSAAVVCVCVLHPSATVLPASLAERERERVKVVDWTACVPGYEIEGGGGECEKLLEEVQDAVDDSPAGPVMLVVDSPDTLCEDIGSTSKAYNVLKSWHSIIENRPAPSRLLLPLPFRSQLLPLLVTPAFAPSLAHLTLHPPSLLHHISTAYLTLPPPHSPPAKFWPVFSGLATRGEAERLVWGADGAGWGDESVVEVLVRSAGGKRSIERGLEGWRRAGVCQLEELKELKDMGSKGSGNQQHQVAVADPTHNLPFNLSLTEAQQHSRAQVPLPYAHEGQPPAGASHAGAIFYDPDSADDIDDDDPDEDLDI